MKLFRFFFFAVSYTTQMFAHSEETQTNCLNDCNDRGRCVSGVCLCNATWTGKDCSEPVARDIPLSYPGLDQTFSRDGKKKSPESVSDSGILRICMVTAEVIGPVSNGGIGTALTSLARSLTAVGHKVTLLFTMGWVSFSGAFEDHIKAYAEEGIKLEALWHAPIPRGRPTAMPRHMTESYEVLRYLRDNNFDIVHFHDYQGAGYYAMLAKRQGLALQNTTTVIGLHGPMLWAKVHGNGETIDKIGDLEMDWMERKSRALADYVVSPSAYLLRWMHENGWPPNVMDEPSRPRVFVQPNVLPMPDRAPKGEAKVQQRHSVRELVFFGRLETRKGIITFCDAVERLLDPSAAPHVTVGKGGLEAVTFMGRGAMVLGRFGIHYVQERAQAWPIKWRIISRLGPQEAKAYLSEEGSGRLAVMPSRIENSPYTVYECAEKGIPFIASDVGGVRDLIHGDDAGEALFSPDVESLAQRLADALAEGVVNARPRVAAYENEAIWVEWHQHIAREAAAERERAAAARAEADLPFVTVIMTHYNRPQLCMLSIESIENQDYPADRFELLLVDDGSTTAEARAFLDDLEPAFRERGWTVLRITNRYLGAARNEGFRHARGKYVLFMDDDNYAKPHEISTYVTAMESGGADVMTSFVDFFFSEDRPPEAGDRPSYLFLGGSAEVGAYKNCFGDANSFVRASSFCEIGGYTEDYGVGFEDWEMYANASLRGFQVDVLPESVYQYRFTRDSMQKTTDYFRNRRRSLRPYLNSLPKQLHSLLLNAVLPRRSDGSLGQPTGLAAEGESRFPGVTNREGDLVDAGGILEDEEQQRNSAIDPNAFRIVQ
uniref:Glycosyl transferase family 1 n=1 Tax=Tetraselmis sp. GSL018 TaxID=582737 RepID=A0A061RCB2_9CHLO|mmetsp:Transcript_5048/g.12304  ORF Transcript_5048/g.12304 Transcript_5048/m.12304 type:complete len:831 (+) Transcript_5048:324-2816(+)